MIEEESCKEGREAELWKQLEGKKKPPKRRLHHWSPFLDAV